MNDEIPSNPQPPEVLPASRQSLHQSLARIRLHPSAAKRAVKAFAQRHADFIGTPSGDTTVEVTFSDDPSQWGYSSEVSTREQKGPPTPRETIDPNCPEQYRNRILFTDLHVKARVSPEWRLKDPFAREPWFHSDDLAAYLVLGSARVPVDKPADSAWFIAAAFPLGPRTEYCAVLRTFYMVTLGSHAAIAPEPAATHIIEHIRIKSIKRMHGSPAAPFFNHQLLYPKP